MIFNFDQAIRQCTAGCYGDAVGGLVRVKLKMAATLILSVKTRPRENAEQQQTNKLFSSTALTRLVVNENIYVVIKELIVEEEFTKFAN